MHPAVEDLHHVLRVGLARGGHLLTAGELVVVEHILALQPEAALLLARLSARSSRCWPTASLPPQVEALREAGLVSPFVPHAWRVDGTALPALRAACQRLGLPRSGRKEAVAARLAGYPWSTEPWVRLAHRALVRRLERFTFLSPWRDRTTMVVERLGHVRWPEYTVSGGVSLFASRSALRRWERVVDELEEAPDLLHALEQGHTEAPAGLCITRWVVRRLAEHARQLERSQQHAEAAALYARIRPHAPPGKLAVRHARALECSGAPAEALALLTGVRDRLAADQAVRIEVCRAQRRLARGLRRRYRPPRPLQAPPPRHLQLPQGPTTGPRPLWRVGQQLAPIEASVQSFLTEHGRTALHSEASVWTTLFAVLFAPAYFLPLPGALPTPYLSGPVDIGTPEFARRRPTAVRQVLDGLDALDDRLAAGERWRDTRLAGAHWHLDASTLHTVAHGIGPRGLRAVMERLLRHGWRAARGLPDLVVLPGDRVRLHQALPSVLPERLVLAEVKGPGDTVRDAQRVWFDVLLEAGVQVELWQVRPCPSP